MALTALSRDHSRPGRSGDWPEPGPIDLGVHDLPHDSSTLEWWYVNCHLELEDGRELAIFAAFFRQLASDPRTSGPRLYTHSVAYGVSLPDRERYSSKVAVDHNAPEVGLKNLDSGVKQDDERVERAYREVLRRGKIPGPTRMFRGAPSVGRDRLALDFDGDRFEKVADGSYALRLQDEQNGFEGQLRFVLEKPASRYGDDGIVHGVSGEQMFYYFVPRARVTGQVVLDGERLGVRRGSGWYDHEFGFVPPPPLEPSGVARAARGETCWRWLALQLDGRRDVSAFFITRRSTGEVLDNWVMLSDEQGRASVCAGATLETLESWRSARTFIEYPVALRLRSAEAGLDLQVRATFPDQEIITVISDPAFWEGTVRVEGRLRGKAVTGRGWLECKGFGHGSLDEFYSAVGREVRARVARLLPLEPSSAAASHWLVRGDSAAQAREELALDGGRLARNLVWPIRDIADRGGKGWRSYAALACIDVVGGDSRRFLHWLAMPEIVHVGSLIVDDVEDESTLRRGGPAAHLLHGLPRAVNAGTAAYFLAEPPIDQDDLPAEKKLRIYRLYFDALRAGHAGQALDLEDPTGLAEEALSSGRTEQLDRHVVMVHRLKTAIPAAMFARAGALLGGGTEREVEALGAYFEAVGLAFQIVDDVLNVRGYERNLKQRGEDISQGKLTLPVALALAALPWPSSTWLWQTVASRPTDPELVERVARLLEECGALEACMARARGLVEEAWSCLDSVLHESQFKLMFRAFGWYVLERHY